MHQRSPVEETSVAVVSYDPSWPAAYESEAARLRALFDESVTAIEHIGSTSVPGLAAKPIVDILVATNLPGAPTDANVRALTRNGYEALGEDGRVQRARKWAARAQEVRPDPESG